MKCTIFIAACTRELLAGTRLPGLVVLRRVPRSWTPGPSFPDVPFYMWDVKGNGEKAETHPARGLDAPSHPRLPASPPKHALGLRFEKMLLECGRLAWTTPLSGNYQSFPGDWPLPNSTPDGQKPSDPAIRMPLALNRCPLQKLWVCTAIWVLCSWVKKGAKIVANLRIPF